MRRFLILVVVGTLLPLAVPAAATADPTALTLVAERFGTTNDIREQGVAGADLHVTTGTAASGDTSVPFVEFNSTVDGFSFQRVDVSAGLAPGAYATSRIPGAAAALLDPGSLGACGNTEPGTMTVLEAQYADDGKPTVFAASFDVEPCEAGQPALHGEIRWNSTQALALAGAPAAVSIAPAVPIKSFQQVPVTVTGRGNAPVILGTAQLTGSTDYWSIAADTCSGQSIDPTATCTITLQFTVGFPNSDPSGPITTWLSIDDGQSTPVSVYAAASVRAEPGQPRNLAVDGAFRHVVVSWHGINALPSGWSVNAQTLWTVYRRVSGGAEEAVGTLFATANATVELAIPVSEPGLSAVYTVQGVQSTITGSPSVPLAATVARRELLVAVQDGPVLNTQLNPEPSSTFTPFVAATTGETPLDALDLTASGDQQLIAWDSRLNGRSVIGLARTDALKQNLPDVSGAAGKQPVWDVDPALSPTGSRMVWVHRTTASATNPVLRMVSTSGGSVQDVPNGAGLTDPTFTADGKSVIAVDYSDGVSRLVRIDLSTGVRTAIAHSTGLVQPAEFLDGRLAAVRPAADGKHLVLVTSAGLIKLSTVPAGTNWHPSWSRDGEIVFLHSDALQPADDAHFGNVFTVDPVSGDVTSVTAGDDVLQSPQLLVEDAPDRTAPHASLSLVQSPLALGSRVTIKPSASDPSVAGDLTSGLASVNVRYRTATAKRGWSAYVYPAGWQAGSAVARSLSLAVGTEYCFSVRARDDAGNTSRWSAESCVERALDDRSLATTGQRKADARYYGGTYTRLGAAKATLSLSSVTAQGVGLVVATCSTCGAVDVYLGSRHLGRVSTHASRTHYQQVIWLPATSTRTGTLTIRSVSSATVRVDGVVTRR